MKNYIEVHTTTGSRIEAEQIAEGLVKNQLAACVQIIGPIRSVYRWKGVVESADEWLCIIKTSKDLFETIQEAITGLHSYEVPQIVAVKLDGVNPSYLSWLEEEISGD